jgi:hypothetical protein
MKDTIWVLDDVADTFSTGVPGPLCTSGKPQPPARAASLRVEARKSALLMCCAFYHEEFKSKVEINLLVTNNLKLEITSLSNYD